MKVKLIRRRGGHDAGSTIEVPDVIGERIVERGEGEEVKGGRRAASKSDDDA